MNRWVTFGCILCFVMAAPPAELLAQSNTYGKRPNTFVPGGEVGADPRVRRAFREKAVAAVGPIARDLVETHGDEAVAALFACSNPVAVKLSEFHTCGDLGKLPRPRDLLRVIAQPRHGDDVALWAISHASELAEADSFDAYLRSPLDYALGLMPLEGGAAEARARRLNQAVMTTAPWAQLGTDEKLLIVGGIGFLVIVGLLLWRRKHSGIC
jgi:hypothetical protein